MTKYQDRRELHREYLRSVGRAGGLDSKKKLEELGLVEKGHWPKHERAYDVIREAFPDFEWVVRHYGDKEGSIVFKNYPFVDGENPSLADLVEEALRPAGVEPKIRVDSLHPSVERKLAPLIRNTKSGKDFCKLLLDLPVVFPPELIMEAVGEWLRRVESGEQSHVFSLVCPDYATRETGDPTRPVEYTFNGLGEGVGLVAKRALASFKKLWEFFEPLGFEVRFVVAMADCEVDSPENLERVGLSVDGFVGKLVKSQEAFKRACPEGMEIETPLLTEIDPKLWYRNLARARLEVRARDYRTLNVSEEDIQLICKARKSLYERWYGALNDEKARETLDKQSPEYMVPGIIAEAHYPNVLILGADAVAMSPFLQGLNAAGKVRPVMYLRSLNY